MDDNTDAHLSDQVRELLTAATTDGRTPGAVAAIAVDGRLVCQVAAGVLATHGDHGEPLPASALQPATLGTRFDLASITKFFSAITLHVLVERGVLGWDEPMAAFLPEWGSGDRARVSLRMLLTHTSGLPDIWAGWRAPLDEWVADHPGEVAVGWPGPPRDVMVESLVRTPLEDPPLTTWRYSCAGYNTAMLLAEAATGRAWADLVESLTLEPLGLWGRITFTPEADETAATEVVPGRGATRGQVHDEASWSMGGASANAGLFGDALSLLQAAEALRLDQLPCSSEPLWKNQLPALLGRDLCDPVESPWGHSMGLRIGQQSWMGDRGGQARGHAGFTGTSFLVDREAGLSVVLLTNRVHPSRDGDIVHTLRAAVAEAAYLRLIE
ncbi:serine hydrolase domain-containing protein [Aestuariimicrobium ganziense]|uniref:serine hydrolase domain-containing protein n=1 Tax=Aestuariimicrobium ganziense TaxID=2773677 RepID=UPI001940BD89|nr:serine hydrolase domain-containing protein [Aestuariimicrobium ganziense]